MSLEKDFLDAISTASESKTKGYKTTATVVRKEGDTVYVHIPGGVDETPASAGVAVSVGDTVYLEVENGKAKVYGNPSNPPTDDTTANVARAQATNAVNIATQAQASLESARQSAAVALTKAEEATASANTAKGAAEEATQSATNAGKAASQAQAAAEAAQGDIDEQKSYFWHDAEGAHVLSEENKARVDIEADGMHIRSLTDTTELAKFAKSGAQIGANDSVNARITERGLVLTDSNGVECTSLLVNAGDSKSKTDSFTFTWAKGSRPTIKFNGSCAGKIMRLQDLMLQVDVVDVVKSFGAFQCTNKISDDGSNYEVSMTPEQVLDFFNGDTWLFNNYSSGSGRVSYYYYDSYTKPIITTTGEIVADNFTDGTRELSDLDNKADKKDVNDALSLKADASALSSYATKTDLNSKADSSALSAYATKTDLSSKADASALSSYATISALNNKADKTALNSKVSNSVTGQDGTHSMGLSWNGSCGLLGVDGSSFTLAMRSDLTNLLDISTKTVLSKKSLSGGAYTSGTVTVTKAGYYPLGIVGHNASGTNGNWCNAYNLYLSAQSDGSATVTYGIRNSGSSAATLTFKCIILWLKK